MHLISSFLSPFHTNQNQERRQELRWYQLPSGAVKGGDCVCGRVLNINERIGGGQKSPVLQLPVLQFTTKWKKKKKIQVYMVNERQGFSQRLCEKEKEREKTAV